MITRENYEEFFLLYTDNELTVAERQEVERFVADHPDLRDEWDALLQCRLSPESNLVFPGRDRLLKPVTEAPSWTEALILYLDNELDAAGRSRVEGQLRSQPGAAKEFAALKRAVVHADPAIVCPAKAGLYREEKSPRVIALPWLRAGIAAAVAGAVALLFLLPSKPSSPSAPSIASRQSRQSRVTKAQAARPTAISAAPVPTAISAAPVETAISRAPVATAVSASHDRNFPPAVTSATAGSLHYGRGQRRTKKAAYGDLASRPAAKSGANPVETVLDAGPGKSALRPDPVSAVTINRLPGNATTSDVAAIVHPAVERGIPKVQSSFATEALQEEATDERDNDFAGDEPVPTGKARLRGILRKVTRAFGKTADRDGDGNRQVLVGAFAVSLN